MKKPRQHIGLFKPTLLTLLQVRFLRDCHAVHMEQRRAEGHRTARRFFCRDLAAKFGISKRMLGKIIERERYRYLR